MNISELLLNIPAKLSSMVDIIYLASKKENKFYKVTYNGNKIKTTEPAKYKAFTKELSKIDPNLANEIGRNNEIRRIYNGVFVSSFKVEGYSMVFIMNLDKPKEEVKEEEPAIISDDFLEIPDDKEKDLLIIADDSELVNNFFSKIFSKDFTVLQASNGAEAKNLILANKDRNLRGIFVDLNMPVMSGYELLEYLNNEGLLEKLNVSVISGEDSSEEINKVTEYAIVDMINKPFGKKEAEAFVTKTINYVRKPKKGKK